MAVNIKRTTIRLDDMSKEILNLKGPFSMTQYMRFWGKVVALSEDDLYKLKKTDQEFAAIMAYLLPKIQRVVKRFNKP